jgi:hypothetical protein
MSSNNKKRCPNGSRKNKQGICVKSKLEKTKKKRCPNGSRKNKQGVCIKSEKTVSKPTVYAKFYDISNKIDPNYKNKEYVTMSKTDFHEKIKKYLNKNKKIISGDILFVGSDYESRQEYGFCLVIGKDVKFGEYGPKLPLRYKSELPHNIKYEKLLQNIKNNENFETLWFGDDYSAEDEVIELYKNAGLY